MVVENMKTLGIAKNLSYIYMYIYIYVYMYISILKYLYSYSIATLYHSAVSKNLIVFSMSDCL